VVVDGNPLEEIQALTKVIQVFKDGEPVPMDAGILFPPGPGGIVEKHMRMIPEVEP